MSEAGGASRLFQGLDTCTTLIANVARRLMVLVRTGLLSGGVLSTEVDGVVSCEKLCRLQYYKKITIQLVRSYFVKGSRTTNYSFIFL